MGKKDKVKKKGKGAEKTLLKTEKKLSNKQKKELAKIGEEDIETIVAKIEKEERQRLKVVETIIEKPTSRSNFTFVTNPEKDELILFGGEYFNGQKTVTYNDLIVYNISHNQWTLIRAPNAPPPRSGHQAVAVAGGGGSMWLFGGEIASQSQKQFHHYSDLWVYDFTSKKWERIDVTGFKPSARSGHRMVYSRKKLFIFGGFQENARGECRYFDDLYIFDIDHRKWIKPEIDGIKKPQARSACGMVPLKDGRILIFGGYSKTKLKKDVDKGNFHTDMFVLTPDKNDTTGNKYKWVTHKPGGYKLSPRTGMTLTLAPNDKAYAFGGVYDVEDDEEDLTGEFYNDFYSLDLEKIAWYTVNVEEKKKKVKDKTEKQGNGDSEAQAEPMEIEQVQKTVHDDGIFTLSVGPKLTSGVTESSTSSYGLKEDRSKYPSSRMNCGLAVKHGTLYLYGGMFEQGDRQITLTDMYSLDLHKLDVWKTLISDDSSQQEWFDSSSESGNSSGSDESDSDEESEEKEESPMDTD